MLLWLGLTCSAQQPQESKQASSSSSLANSRATDEVVSNIPLDGSIVIDETIWVTLLGEPGAHMFDAYKFFQERKLQDAGKSIGKASSFLMIASDNAFAAPAGRVRHAAEELDRLQERLENDQVVKDDEIKDVFARVHLAMSHHHAKKAAAALERKQWAVASNYLISSAKHLQRASDWSDRALKPDTKESLAEAKETAGRLIEDGGTGIESVSRVIERLGRRIERFGKSWREEAKRN
jgi:hypothetical protein